MRRPASPGGQQGFALIIALWAAVLLGVIAARFVLSMHAESRLAGNLVEAARAEALADAGVRRGILALLADDGGRRWIADGRSYELPLGDGSVRIRLSAESSKVNLNTASEDLIHGLLASLARRGALESRSEAARIADAILDWRDAEGRARPRGGEDARYEAGGYPRGARDGAFVSVAELDRVPGVTAEVYARLAPWFTVHSPTPRIDPRTAPREVLLAVPGLESDALERFLEAREAAYGSHADARARLPMELLSAGNAYLAQSEPGVFTVDAEGVLFEGARARRRAVVELTGSADRPYVILAWLDAASAADRAWETRAGG